MPLSDAEVGFTGTMSDQDVGLGQEIPEGWETPEPEEIPEPSGILARSLRAAARPLLSTAGGIGLLASPETTEKRALEFAAKEAAEPTPTLPQRAGEFIGGLAGQLAVTGPIAGTAGPVGAAGQFALQSAFDSYQRAFQRALNEGKGYDEARDIAKAVAPAGAAAGVALGLALPGPTATLKQAARAGLVPGGVAAGTTVLQNLYERALGLQTPVGAGAAEAGATMALLPVGGYAVGRALAPLLRRPAAAPEAEQARAAGLERTAAELEKEQPRLTPEEQAAAQAELEALQTEPTPEPAAAAAQPERIEDASKIGEAAKVYGDVRPSTGEGAGEVPAKISGEGIQLQAPEGQAKPEVLLTDAQAEAIAPELGAKWQPQPDAWRYQITEGPALGNDVTVPKGSTRAQVESAIEAKQAEYEAAPETEVSRMLREAKEKPVPEKKPPELLTPKEWQEKHRLYKEAQGVRLKNAVDVFNSLAEKPNDPARQEAARKMIASDPYASRLAWSVANGLKHEERLGVTGPSNIARNKRARKASEFISKQPGFLKENEMLFLHGDQKRLLQSEAELLTDPKAQPALNAEAVELHGVKLPEGYVKVGDKYVFRPGEKPVPPVTAPPAAPPAAPPGAPPSEPELQYRHAGIPMPGAEKLNQGLRKLRDSMVRIWKSSGQRKLMDQTFDAADTQAAVAGGQSRKHLELTGNADERKAAYAYIEADGDPNKLMEFLRQARAGGNKDAEKSVQYALAHLNDPNLVRTAAEARRILDKQIADEHAAGINTEYHDSYVPHIYDQDLLMGAGRPVILSGAGGRGTATGFKKGRAFNTIFEAIEQGYTPKSLDVGQVIEHRVRVGQKLINRQAWGNALRGVVDPTDNKPIVTSLERRSRGPGLPSYEVAPMGYAPRDLIPGVRVAVHEGYGSLWDALTGTSRISGSEPGAMALKIGSGIKHGLLMFDTFHASRIMQKMLFLTGKVSYKKGQTLLEYADADLNAAVRNNEITQDMADWARMNRADAQLLLKSGLNVGRIAESLYSSVIRDTPIIGPFNKWVFEKLTRGAMMESGIIELERYRRAFPKMTDGQRAIKIARDLNVYFGNLGRQGLFKSQTMQDLARLFALAPNWVESMIRTEIGGAKQLALDPLLHRELGIASIGRGMANGLAAYFIATQLLNLATRKKFTWDNEEPGHKLDAWIPDVTGKTTGFFISPFSVVAEITHDMIRYSHSEPNILAAASRIATNKASPIFRAGRILLTGRDWDQRKLITAWERARAAAWALAPTPIPLSPVVKGGGPPGQVQRQLTASLGFKTEPAGTAGQQVRSMVRDWMKNNPDPKIQAAWQRQERQELGESVYRGLRMALMRDDTAGALKEYAKLRETHKPVDIMEAMRGTRPFSGSYGLEIRFKKDLTPEHRRIYDAAKQERVDLFKRFKKMLGSRVAQQ